MSGFKPQVAASELIRRDKGTAGSIDERKSKDAYKREKDLEEERKLGLAPACVDVSSGRDINPHIPHFITQTPWYVPTEGPTLKHQRPHWEREEAKKKYADLKDWYHRGTTGKAATVFRKGACENCGAMTHKKRDCFERPRKTGANLTGDDIASDDFVQPTLKMDFEAKRDRWNGYDPATYQEVIKEHEKQEEVRKILKAEKLREPEKGPESSKEGEEEAAVEEVEKKEELVVSSAMTEEEDEDKYAEDADMAGVSVDMDSRTRITVRNLRIREDTAKYLYNLNENSPYYDPKSRSMRENPLQGVKGKEKESAKFAGENFTRYTGEVVEANEAQVFAWQARCKGIDVHALAEPTKLEALQKEFKTETKDVREEQKKSLLEKYGGAEHLALPARELLLAQTETYVEYSRKGNVIKGAERPSLKSRYEEDIYPNNHTSVFGSFWQAGRWGYRCCHSTVRNSYCIGEKGLEVDMEMPAKKAPIPEAALKEGDKVDAEKPKEEEKEEVVAIEEKEKKKEESSSSSSSSSSASEASSDSDGEEDEEARARKEKLAKEKEEEREKRERHARRTEKRRQKRKRRNEKMGGKRKKKRDESSSDSASSGSESSSDEDDTEDAKLQKAVLKAQKEERRARREAKKGDRKRKYHSNYEAKAPTEIEMEAFKLTRIHSSDPMAEFMQEKRRKKE